MKYSKERLRGRSIALLDRLSKTIHAEAVEILGEDLEPKQLEQLVVVGSILEGGNDFGKSMIFPELLADKDFVERARSVARKLMTSGPGGVEKLEDATNLHWYLLAGAYCLDQSWGDYLILRRAFIEFDLPFEFKP